MQLVEQKNRDITGSLNYASRIQKAVLGSAEHISNAFAEAFVFFKSHSIVSGDFYWYHEIQSENKKILITADCTGHGVPGAFMTVIGHNFLDEIVIGNQVFEPSEILYKLDEKVKKTLKRNIGNEKVNDGMDLSVLVFDTTTNCLKYAGAKSSVFIFRGDYHREIKGSVFPIGGNDMRKKAEKKFETIVTEVQKNDMIYTFSDGFQDQFGGEKNRKYMKSRFRDFLLQISGKPVDTQKQAVETEITAWRGQNPQTDDMLIIGIRI
jgi:serine phosphatase RsbU (regulator of sigma subunit)